MTNVIEMPTRLGVSTDLAPAPAIPALSKRSPFYGVDRGEEIAATYHAHDTRATVGKAIHGRGRKEVLSLIYEAIDAGILKPTGAATKRPTLRLLIPDGPIIYCSKFDLTSPAVRKRIREEVWPAVLAHKDEVLANPGNLENIVERWRRESHAARSEARKVEEIKRAVVAVTAAGQEPCIMFGVTLWPRPGNDFGTYNYDQIRVAAWTFRDWNMWLDKSSSPASKAICIRNMIRWLVAFHDRVNPSAGQHPLRKAVALIGTIAGLMEKNPTGECRIPCDPKIEGQW